MSEIKIHVDDSYLQTLLSFLQTLSYVRVEVIENKKGRNKPKQANGSVSNANEAYLATLPPGSTLRAAFKPMRKNVTAEDLIRESGYVRTDWEKIRQIGIEMDIPQSVEELLAQLTP